jgi:hypothetical protein
MKMPKVGKCEVTACAFNRQEACHAPAITVGDGDRPRCDTYVESSSPAGEPDAVGKVGACKVTMCEFNRRMECSASKINVGYNRDDPCCMTFERAPARV